MTKRDAVDAAMSVAQDVADGKLDPAELEAAAVAELGELFGTVVGEGDPSWPMHCSIAKQAIALGALSGDELAEWAAVFRQRGDEPVSQPDPDEATPTPGTSASGMLSPDSGDAEAADQSVDARPDQPADADAGTEPEPPIPPRRADTYDPLRGWSPGGSLR
jgi:hypothetical protein